ncbi:Inositol 2-dehydrogenase/D-chiro-inositol 3-dehydrogenase [Paenibacillus solanacearum]|uniref:Inositol 2-dehydrogenase/D-chiro-inositol 3-dehydrogenase n=1 Tax=Paenibacillus solanacearum TaxID=2048548 RepID=A0A916NQT2_9BACL|nr:Gfo/Idh/MocA family oxidoreductase [Paenibacillus solanacearum]CAG7641395.1 Inositol 2-dehydrogenase/D-chiro-inositol 3-dehydrogenase [Paenibacillus solanacearum]
MSVQHKVKIGLVGLGNIGRTHIRYLSAMDHVELVGVCDTVKERADQYAVECGTDAYYSHTDLFDRSGLEAVIIAVPHYDHTTISVDAFERGLHVMCEKPLAVHVNDAKKSLAAYEKANREHPNLMFGIMFQERTLPFYKKLKDIVDSGELGRLTRVTWINTAWFRSQAYYDSGDWRATWAGEGGGILTNQCPHNLDTYQWLFGLPARISGHAHIGKYHNIEVEDEVTAYFEHENGMIGHFIVTTAESPGTNRMEIIGENGKLVYENGKIILYKNRISMLQHLRESKSGFDNVESWYTEIPVRKSEPNGHKVVTEAFVQAILRGGGELIAHGTEGIKGLTIGNGIMLSSFKKAMVDVPFDADEYERILKELIRSSKYKKAGRNETDWDMSGSFSTS